MSPEMVGNLIGLFAGCVGVWFATWRTCILFDPFTTSVPRATYEWTWRCLLVSLPLALALYVLASPLR